MFNIITNRGLFLDGALETLTNDFPQMSCLIHLSLSSGPPPSRGCTPL